jgi:type II secretory pathway pseudopilin PulG
MIYRTSTFQRSAHRASHRRSGFTLIEAALATIIIGVAFTAVLQLMAAGTVANVDATALTTGTNLARNIRELTLQKTYASLPTYNNASYKPPRDSRGTSISSLGEWQQVITVQAVDPNNLKVNQVDPTPAAVRITVTVNRNSQKVCDLSWYCFDATP